jgi:hypothetical protein
MPPVLLRDLRGVHELFDGINEEVEDIAKRAVQLGGCRFGPCTRPRQRGG